MGEHGHWQKTTLFENATRVPLIIAAPGMKTAGQSTNALAEMIDFYPTLAALCGLNAPNNLSGVSLTPVLNDVEATPRTAAFTQYANGYSIRTAQHRYTEWGPDGREGAELYDHASDPAEMKNLANDAGSAATRNKLSKILRQRIRQAHRKPDGLEQRIPRAK
jgi:arylsulfatase A-like enzyme